MSFAEEQSVFPRAAWEDELLAFVYYLILCVQTRFSQQLRSEVQRRRSDISVRWV